MGKKRISRAYKRRRILQRIDILNRTYSIQILVKSEDKREKLRIYSLQEQQGTKKRIASVGNNMNSLIRTNAIGLL
jgi:hypothetical protein